MDLFHAFISVDNQFCLFTRFLFSLHLYIVDMLPSFRIMGKSAPALTRAFRATACRSAVVGSTADAKVTKDLGTAYPIGLPYSSPAHA